MCNNEKSILLHLNSTFGNVQFHKVVVCNPNRSKKLNTWRIERNWEL